MSMLTRYQKSGGFIQLLQLIETCGKQKQENFLQMIEKEDPRWANAIKEKMLTIEKIFSWEDAVLHEISGRLQELTLATVVHGLKPEERDRFLSAFTHSQRRNIDDLSKAKNPSAAELSSAFIKILQEVRNMITMGYLRPEKFAPELALQDGIEEKIGKSMMSAQQANANLNSSPGENPSSASSFEAAYASAPTPAPAPARAAGGSNGSGHESADVSTLRNKLHALAHENTQLKNELKIYKEKIMQIRKIA